ncbi:hypothetical protein PHAVU_010G053300 [Phaseolus vulgaris]|uniref:Phosphoglycerate mutase family protein n=1 Tax=Phaseolus vulgaris TaxID=3885 RepID=V7AQL0_PHAVU|nr:hypothetical protein PHAVU_010G053300g [Phaseolus vulgaris]ESW06501.1 hypothetical protein PHAVU_010G053300g [Phaseolus vulgaris]
MASSGVAAPEFYQNVVVMRHGDRIDNFEPMWVSSATRPWDPPLIQQGRVRAFSTGRELRKKLPFTLNRVFVSPFHRCVQTAAEVVAALSAVSDEEDPSNLTGDGVPIDPSKIKVSVEYGLCEMMSRAAIRLDVIPKDGNWGFDIPKLEAMLPAGTVDKNVERVYKKLPQWEEDPNLHTRPRYKQIVKDLADKYHTENLLLVTHGEGVGVAFSSFQKEVEVYDVEYCGYIQLRRPIFKKDQSFTAGEFEAIVHNGQTGIKYTQKT